MMMMMMMGTTKKIEGFSPAKLEIPWIKPRSLRIPVERFQSPSSTLAVWKGLKAAILFDGMIL